MARLKKCFKVLFIISLLALLPAAYGWKYWQDLKHDLGLTVDWQGLGIGRNGLLFNKLTVTQQAANGGRILINGDKVTVSRSTITAQQLTVVKERGNPVSTTSPTEPINLLKTLNQLKWLPNTINIESFIVTLPCPAGQCITTGKLAITQNSKPNVPFSLAADLYHKDQNIHLNADLHQLDNYLDLQVTGQLNKQPLLNLTSQFDAESFSDWQGKLQIFKLEDSRGLFEWLQQWLPSKQPIKEIPEALQVSADWQLYLSKEPNTPKIRQGHLTLDASLPNPWPFPGLGYLQGQINTELTVANRQLTINQLQTDMKLSNIDKTLVEDLPKLLIPESVSLQLQSTDKQVNTATISLKLIGKGQVNTQLTSQLTVDIKQLSAKITSAELKADTDQFTFEGFTLEKPQLSLPFTGQIDSKKAELTLGKDASITMQALSNSNIKLKTTKLTATAVKLNAQVDFEQLSAKIISAELKADTDKLTYEGFTLQKPQLSLPFTGQIDSKKTELTLGKDALVTLQEFSNADINLKTTKLTTTVLKLNAQYADKDSTVSASGPINLSIDSVKAPTLRAVSWKASGQLDADTKQLTFNGKVNNGVELSADTTVTTIFDKHLKITAKTPEIFLRTTNPFAKTFSVWPEILEFATGKASIDGSLTITFDKNPLKANAKLMVNGLSGIYDRSEIKELTGRARIDIQNNKLQLDVPALSVKEANAGIVMGPITFNGQYNTPLNKLLEGNLQWSKAELKLFAGRVWLKPDQLNLANLPQRLNLQIEGLQLTQIFLAYPAEGLAGQGRLDGTLPITISKDGIEVNNGSLGAREAGYLKFDSPKIKALGQSNPNMRIATDALENFNYTKLETKVSYNQGKASFAFSLNGQNPNLEKGRAINLNVNLEEDIPSLMTSLQLSDRVSEPIRKRVEEHLKQHDDSKSK